MKNYKITVAGTGYVGLSIATLLSQHHQVTAVLMVLASELYDENDYIRNYDDFLKYVEEHPEKNNTKIVTC